MKNLDVYRIAISSFIALLFFTFSLLRGNDRKTNKISVQFIARSGIFSAIAILLYIIPFFNFSLPFFPSFLNIHFDEIPAFIAGFAYGPWCAVFVLIVKTIVKLPMTSTLGVGELCDLIYSLSFILPAVFVYKRKKNIKNAFFGLTIGTISQIIIASFLTTFGMLDFYMWIFQMNEETLLYIMRLANPYIQNIRWPYFFMISIPFNFLKNIMVIFITLLIYKRLHRLFDKIA